LKENFQTTSGDPVVAIPMGSSEEQAYKNLMCAFRNQQKNSYEEVLDVGVL